MMGRLVIKYENSSEDPLTNWALHLLRLMNFVNGEHLLYGGSKLQPSRQPSRHVFQNITAF